MNTSAFKRISILIIFCMILFLGHKYVHYRGLNAGSVGIIEYEDSYINAKDFRDEFQKNKRVDSMYIKDSSGRKFIFERVKILRSTNGHIEAVSIPRTPSSGHYYLIVDDSVFQMSLIINYNK